ncbi:receptor-like protein 56 [Alnus glutinosa]|uniref:receptor-like protein 56 n=1 Tax=Alnus glutinosa TaxID=3517 RepID=UPI002D78AB5F|nr:receptor-like protein 56 [Alnus glutinosa]
METSCFAKNVIFVWALAIIALSPLACVKAGCTKKQTRALLEIKNATNASSLAGWDGRDCCKVGAIFCGGVAGGVSEIDLYGEYDSSRSTWYPNVTLFILFDELEKLSMYDMQIGGGLQAFCELKRLNHLRYLELQVNRLEGVIPSCLGMIGNLQYLDLSSNRFHGNLPPSIFSKQSKIWVFDVSDNQLDGLLSFSTFANASSLQYLYLSGNRFHGNLPPSIFSKQSKISYFDVSANQLDGVLSFSTFANASSLQYLNLAGNYFHGNLPPSIFSNQSQITEFVLSDNQLEGLLPFSIFANAPSLENLDLSGNHFQGNLPPLLFSNQSRIGRFDVSSNQLEGVLPFSIFANASSLYYLDLSSNCNLEVETESSSWVPTFQLTYLNLANCSLNKRNGHVIPSFISTQDSLKWLDLSHNLIEGSIPCQLLFSKSISVLSLRSSKIDGSLSLGCFANRTSSLRSFDISDNNVTGSIPENIGHLLPSLYHVDMSSNALEGIIPLSFGDLHFEILDLSNNMLSGTIPQSLTRDGTPLVYLNLSNNKLKGEMLPRDANMTWLECLQLSGNQFEGIISPTISNSPSLVILDIRKNSMSGNIPKWLYDHPRLVAVLISGNRFEGHLLRRMCQMESLQVFDISDNLILGSIPSCLDNITFWKKSSPSSTDSNYFTRKGRLYYLVNANQPEIELDSGRGFPVELDIKVDIGTDLRVKHILYTFKGVPLLLMTGIDMSSNQLTGGIPSEMGELSQLRSLNLSNNFLTGPIPSSFQNLKNVESLDLSHNKLSGGIPYELVGLTSLSTFFVAYNNLSGRIPFEQQFSTFGIKSYDGNPDLCGDPMPRNCSPTNQLEPGHKDEKEETRIIDSPLFFYAFVAVSYAFGFWVFFGILIINKNWRHIYFRAVDRFIESCFEMLSKYR